MPFLSLHGGARFTPLPLLGFILALSPSSSSAQDGSTWAAPFQRPSSGRHTVASYMEEQFADVFRTCGIGRFRSKKTFLGVGGGNKDLSTVPLVLQGNVLPREREVHEERTRSLARLFAYISENNEDPATTNSIIPRRYLKMDWVQPEQTMMPSGESQTIYFNSCESVVDAAANAKAGGGIAGNTISAAVASSANSTRDQGIALYAGSFQSPIDFYLNRSGPEKLFGHMLVWEWYRSNPPAIATGGRYKARFDGLVLTKRLTHAGSQSLRTTFQGGASVPLAGIDASFKSEFTAKDQAIISLWRTVEYRPADPADSLSRLASLPDLNDIRTVIQSSFKPDRLNPTENVLVQGGSPLILSWRVQGIPHDLCNMTEWSLVRSGYLGGDLDPKLTRETRTSDPWVPCRLDLTYTPPADLWNRSGAESITLRAALRSVAQESGVEKGRMDLGPIEVTLTTRRFPNISLHNSDPHWTGVERVAGAGPAYSRIRWENVTIHIDGGDRVDWPQNYLVRTDSLYLRCPLAGKDDERIDLRIGNPPTLIPTWEGALSQLRLPLVRNTVPGETLDTTAQARQCSLVGSLWLRVRGNPSYDVSQPLPRIPIYYPAREAPVSAPAPQPAAPVLQQPPTNGSER